MYESYDLTGSDELDAFALMDELDDLELLEEDEEESYLDMLSDEELELLDDTLHLGEALREVLSEEYAEAAPEEMEAALLNVMDALTPAESVSFANALRQGAGQLVRDPTFKQFAGAALPLAGGVVGTTLGGPAGTMVGGTLGREAAKALAGGGTTRSTAAVVSSPKPSVAPAAVLPAARKGVVLMNDPVVQQAALAAALGPHGRPSVNGFPVPAILEMLSTIFGQAAAEADELMYESSATPAYMLDEQTQSVDPAAPGDRAHALYAAFLRGRDQHLAEGVDWP